MNVIFWDTETNGLKEYHSVLSISAIKYSFIIEGLNIESNKIEQYERFYFRKPGEKIGEKAIAINGLTDEVISKRRNGLTTLSIFIMTLHLFAVFVRIPGILSGIIFTMTSNILILGYRICFAQ